MERISSYSDFLQKSAKTGKSFLLLYKSDSDQSNCAFQSLKSASDNIKSAPVYFANVTQVRDIHTRFGISSVPSLLIFGNGKYENNVKGCHENTYYQALIESSVFQANASSKGNVAKRVTIYSTPTCSWCNTLKSWLRKNNIHYTDIDVSRDKNASEEMVRRTGQQGVPQTEINGQMVVGFNQSRLKELLEIQ